ncbi:carbonic anhydrase family protein [Marinactinospora thermotolerans]|uniref:carbonic anhydrase family protein n=1 Tax=Marinactinospora thermotolerans TaxID=531310 RepID=UPI003D924667
MSQETVSEQDGSIEAGRPRRWGFEQSPVNIRTDLLTHRRLPRLEFAYGNSAKIELEYVRHPADEPPGLGVHRPEENVAGHIRSHDHHLRVGDADYVLSEVHWHTPSEHLIDGRTFWAEHHLNTTASTTPATPWWSRSSGRQGRTTPTFSGWSGSSPAAGTTPRSSPSTRST